MAGSTLPDFCTALKRALLDKTVVQGPPLVQVAVCAPQALELEAIVIDPSDVTGEVEIPNLRAGRKAREERYRIQVVSQTMLPGMEAETALQRARDLDAAADEVLADDVTLGGIVLWAHSVGYQHYVGALQEQGYGARYERQLLVCARIY